MANVKALSACLRSAFCTLFLSLLPACSGLADAQFLPAGGGLFGAPSADHRQVDRAEPMAAGEPVYSADECTGPVIMGRCHGAVVSKRGYQPTCHGEWLDGQCTGPMF